MNTLALQEFERYVERQIAPATADINNLADENRLHVQKLVYTNLVDRFDAMIDNAILGNCRAATLVERAMAAMAKEISEADLVRFLIDSGDIQTAVDERLRAGLRNSVMRDRHSMKLAALFDAFGFERKLVAGRPRVNVNTGRIIERMKPLHSTIPHSICGYADWLYARRNSVVHGAGTTKFLSNDRAQLKKLYNCEPAKILNIRLSSITTTAAFYKDVVSLFVQKVSGT
jgi:hypothetical protein